MKVMLADDDLDLVDITTYALRREGYSVVAARDGAHALQLWEEERPDLVLLDARLPRIDGFEVCKRIRDESDTPVLMVTACADEAEKIRGLRSGADDYVTKPFSPKELTARMRAVMRRSNPGPYQHPTSALQVGNLSLDLQSYEVVKDGELIQLTPLEFRILYILAMNEGRVIPYGWLVQYAWGHEGADRSLLKTHVCHIRKKLNLVPDGPGDITAVPSVGYRLLKS